MGITYYRKKIFSLEQVAKSFGLTKIPYSKTFFKIIDQSFYLKLAASYPILRQSENANAFKGTKFHIEASSRLFRDIDLAAFIDFINLKSDSEASGNRFGVSIGFAFIRLLSHNSKFNHNFVVDHFITKAFKETSRAVFYTVFSAVKL